jgi:hypothetical protein
MTEAGGDRASGHHGEEDDHRNAGDEHRSQDAAGRRRLAPVAQERVGADPDRRRDQQPEHVPVAPRPAAVEDAPADRRDQDQADQQDRADQAPA